jgi:hypothetical protein
LVTGLAAGLAADFEAGAVTRAAAGFVAVAWAFAVGLELADTGPTPLTCRTRPAASAAVNTPAPRNTPPAARATANKLAAPVTINLVEMIIALPSP